MRKKKKKSALRKKKKNDLRETPDFSEMKKKKKKKISNDISMLDKIKKVTRKHIGHFNIQTLCNKKA